MQFRKAAADSYPPFAFSLARFSASPAVAPFAEPLLPFSVTVALVSDESLRFPSSGGGKLTAHLARRRENADAWLFEM